MLNSDCQGCSSCISPDRATDNIICRETGDDVANLDKCPLDAAIVALVKKAEKEFFPWVVEELKIETNDQLKNAADLLGIGKALSKELEAARKAEKQPFMDKAAAVDTKYKPIQSKVTLGVTRIDQAVIAYHEKQKKLADELLLLQAQEIASKVAESKETGEVVELESLVVEPVKDTIRGHMGTTNVQETPEFTVMDEKSVPAELKTTDLKKVKAYYNYLKSQGMPIDIPGIMVTYKKHTVSRLS